MRSTQKRLWRRLKRLEFLFGVLFFLIVAQMSYFYSQDPPNIEKEASNVLEPNASLEKARVKVLGTIPTPPKKEKAVAFRLRKEIFGKGRDNLGNQQYPVHVPLPIFVASLPKSGTTSIHRYFLCGGHESSHQWIGDHQRTGECIRENLHANRPPFEECGPPIVTDAGFAIYNSTTDTVDCFTPSIEALNGFYKHYPRATIVHGVRNASAWYDSFSTWANGNFVQRWHRCFGKWNRKEWMDFYEWHRDSLRQFAQEHPSITFIEVALEDRETGTVLEDMIGIPAECWGRCSPLEKVCEKLQ